MTTTTTADRPEPPTPGAALPVREAIARAYPDRTRPVGLSNTEARAFSNANSHPDGPRYAAWHRPESEWWDGDQPAA